ncbi:MAG TPA: cyclic nucleotide-binding domain-containing protein [Burkholderiaceae bacterium]|mgnify:CR=1 FL=1|jgi:CRP-like cAMP-binding protein|nr:cyclic nucleotide-binding domain-containing protein [Burkholderiaceae bacterium]
MMGSLLDNLTAKGRRKRAVQESPTAELAARMLRAPSALIQLSEDDARVIVSYMEPRRFDADARVMTAGDTENTDYMLLVLEGAVTVESVNVSRKLPITVTVLGPGSMLGEMSLLDGSPRSVTCTAGDDLLCAQLTREGLQELIQDDSILGIKLLIAIGMRMAERLRDNTDKLWRYARLTQAMQQEIDRLMPT